MRLLFIGDIVGKPGLDLVRDAVPVLRRSENLDFVIANAENAANGSGLLPNQYHKLREWGVDAVTLGDHIYKKADIIGVLTREDRVCKPANFPPEAPGREYVLAPAADGTPVAVVSLQGRTFMKPVDCPFHAADRVLAGLAGTGAVVVVDAHAEATAEKYLLAHHLAGRAAAVLGTHTHVPTADEQILPGGTAFVCDVGMTGPYASILGRRVDRVLSVAVTFVPAPYDVATDDVRLGGAVVDVDPATGRATAVRRLMVTPDDVRRLAGA